LTENSASYDDWIRALREVRIIDRYYDTARLDPDKTKQVTLTAPAWAAASMDHKCPDCGWPVYIIAVGSSQYLFCTNPECSNSPIFRSISEGLKHYDQMRWEQRQRNQAKNAKRESEKRSKEKEEQRLEIETENRVRRILLSYGVTPKRRTKT